MARYADPRLVDHAEGIEQRIIELSRRIDVLDRNHATHAAADRLRASRRELLAELVDAADVLTRPPRAPRRVAIRAPSVTPPHPDR